jgi:hypothetical protein
MLESIYEKLSVAMEELKINHNNFINKNNKSAAQRARIAAQKVKNLITIYKKANIDRAN